MGCHQFVHTVLDRLGCNSLLVDIAFDRLACHNMGCPQFGDNFLNHSLAFACVASLDIPIFGVHV